MFKIQDGRKSFTQWDLNRKIIVEDDSITRVHFTNSNRIGENALVCEVIDNVVNVPNIILQGYGTIFVYGCDSNYTKYIEAFDIIRREKPDGYIYTETEVLNYNNLLEKINSVEGSIEQVVADYLRENPPQVDLSGYATKEYVDNAIAAITAVDLSNYFTKEEANAKFATKEEIPSTSGLATEQYVNEAIAGIKIPEVIKHISITDINQLLNLETGYYYVDDGFSYEGNAYFGNLIANKKNNIFTFIDALNQFEYSGEDGWYSYLFVNYDEYLEIRNRVDNIESAGFQTETQVNTLISNAISAIGAAEGGTY